MGLLLLGTFSNDIIGFQQKHQSSFELTALIENLITDLENPTIIPILRAKCLWTVSRFSEIIAAQHKEIFLPLFKVAASSISKENPYAVRMTATKALGMYNIYYIYIYIYRSILFHLN